MIVSIKFRAAVETLKTRSDLVLHTLYDALRQEKDHLEKVNNRLNERPLLNNIEIASITKKISDVQNAMTAVLEAKRHKDSREVPEYRNMRSVILTSEALLKEINTPQNPNIFQKAVFQIKEAFKFKL